MIVYVVQPRKPANRFLGTKRIPHYYSLKDQCKKNHYSKMQLKNNLHSQLQQQLKVSKNK